jgi:Ca-activated chloride channel family protein
MSFLTPLALLAGLLAIPILLLYMLRLRRREITVSSTFLWQQVVRDNEANTPWQRLRRNLLLFLQLLILAALVFALARPFITVPTYASGERIILLDASASMNATDTPEGSRFETAKTLAREIIQTVGPNDQITLIRVADIPEVLNPASNDQASLLQVLENAQPGQSTADWSSALAIAAGLSTEASLLIISDGGLGDTSLLPELPENTQYLPVGTDNANVAITAMATGLLPGAAPQLFTQITNYSTASAEITFSLYVDDALFSSAFYTLDAGEERSFVSQDLPQSFHTLAATVAPRSGTATQDHLAQDNQAWAVVDSAESRRVLLMTPGNLFLEQVLRSLPSVSTFRGDIHTGIPQTQEFDLIILDDWLPETLPDGDLLIINPPQDSRLFSIAEEESNVQAVRVQSSDPRMNFVDFSNVNIRAFRALSRVAWATPLIQSENGPLLVAGEVDGRRVSIIPFALHDSDLPLQITFPILMSNLLEWYTPQSIVSGSVQLQPGDSLRLRPPPQADEIRIHLPDGTQRNVDLSRELTVFAETTQTGIYRLEVVEAGEITLTQYFVVNLFAPQESDLTVRQELSLSSGAMTLTAGEREAEGQLEFWSWVALLAFALLLIEWYAYHQRLKPPIFQRQRMSAKS